MRYTNLRFIIDSSSSSLWTSRQQQLAYIPEFLNGYLPRITSRGRHTSPVIHIIADTTSLAGRFSALPCVAVAVRTEKHAGWDDAGDTWTSFHDPRNIYTVSRKKPYTWLLIITSANVDRFTALFYRPTPEEILHTHTHTHHKDF